MKREAKISLFISALALALVFPAYVNAQKMEASTASPNTTTSPTGLHEAMQMVPAQASLVKPLDARKAQPGSQFTVVLSDTVHLKDGTELPHGTKLLGLVSTDDMELRGTSKLVLRITRAELKDGKVLPIKATIVGIDPPGGEGFGGYSVSPGNQHTNEWTSQTLQIDQIDALSGVDLHSRIASRNSGVFVSTKKDDVKLSAGSEFALAIAARTSVPQNVPGTSGGA